jgi:signal transduction histidine kinase
MREISEPLLAELMGHLRDEAHLAIIAPRQSGKALVLHELRRRALLEPGMTPRVVVLRALNFTLDSPEGFLRQLAECLVPARAQQEPLTVDASNLRAAVVDVIEAACRADRAPLWLFVQSIPEFPAPWARALLSAFQHFSEEGWAALRLSVLVTGCHDLVPLTYDQNSPYRHARKYFLTGLDRELTRRYFVLRVRGEPLDQGFLTSDDDSAALLSEDALDVLYQQTAGYARFIEEVVLTASRPGMHGRRPSDGVAWTVAQIENLIDCFVREHLAFEPYCRLSLEEIERDRQSWDTLVALLRIPAEPITVPSSSPQRIETAGIARRDDRGVLRLASPMWERYLERVMTREHRADVLALQLRWDEAWELYETIAAADCDRPLDGKPRYYWRRVVRNWEESLIDAATTESQKPIEDAWRFFSEGMKHLYGMQCGELGDRRNGEVHYHFSRVNYVGQFKRFVDRINGLPQSVVYDTGNPGVQFFHPLPGRVTLLSAPAGSNSNWERFGIEPLLRLERRPEREIDSITQPELRRTLRRFWSAMEFALRRTFDAELGGIRERHLQVVAEVNRLAGQGPGLLQRVIQGSARALVETGGYFRSLICLVNPTGEWIEGVAGHCRVADLNFRDRTRYPLSEPKAGEKPDVQRWVVLRRCTVAIADATREDHPDVRINRQQAIQLRMKGIAVIPIVLLGPQGEVVEVLGTLHVEREDGGKPGEPELKSLEILAGQMATVFDQARRTDLLEQALDRVDTQFRLFSQDARVIYRNLAASKSDTKPPRTWFYPLVPVPRPTAADHCNWPVMQNVLKNPLQYPQGDHRYYNQPGNPPRVWDDFAAPLVDFRCGLPYPFTADGRAGAVHQATELTDIVEMSLLLQKLLSIGDIKNTAHRVIEFFEQRGFKWARLYSLNVKSDGGDCLCSCDEFGLSLTATKQKFRAGHFKILRTPEEQPAWLLFDREKKPVVFEHEEHRNAGPQELGEVIPGIPLFRVHDKWREEFQKDDQRWIEAPLMVGDVSVGLIAASLPEDLSPRFYEQFRSWCASIAAAMYFANIAEEGLKRARRAGEEAAVEMAIHQLSNVLGPGESACHFARILLESDTEITAAQRESARSDLGIALESFERSRHILMDFRRYAADRAFRDEQSLPVGTVLAWIAAQLQALWRDVEFSVDPQLDDHEITTSLDGLREVFEILASNSVRHANARPGLKVTLTAEVDDPAGTSCCLVYIDNGVGVPDELKERIFEPFVTTNDQGTGLGLPIARRLLRQLRGTIRETGLPGEGVRFVIELPRTLRPTATELNDA